MPQIELSVWTITDHPADFPTMFVARHHIVGPVGERTTDEIILSPSLEGLRYLLELRGLTNAGRRPEDHPVIVESWI